MQFKVFLLLLIFNITQGVNLIKTEDFKVDLSGFFRTDMFWDSSQVVAVRDKTDLLYPTEKTNTNCCQQAPEDNGEFGITSVLSRVYLDVIHKEKDKKIIGKLEFDFYGKTEATTGSPRLRKAYLKYENNCLKALAGQDFQPLSITHMIPDTVSFDAGVPTLTYALTPQVYAEYETKHFKIRPTIYQNGNSGPDGFSKKYSRNSLLPKFNLLTEFKSKNIMLGLTADFQKIIPNIKTSSNNRNYNSLSSHLISLYTWIKRDKFYFKSRFIYGNNGAGLGTLGGYAIKTTSSETGDTFANINSWSLGSEISLQINSKISSGLFVGVAKNIGTSNCTTLSLSNDKPTFYGLNERLGEVIRVSPRIWIKPKDYILIGAEIEWVKASFGTMDNKGKITPTTHSNNTRFIFVSQLMF
jgi:hypothetical protein